MLPNSIKNQRNFLAATFLLLAACLSAAGRAASALDLQGKVDTSHTQGNANSNYIQGGIKDEASLEPSLKVIPGQVKKGTAGQLQRQTPQYFFPADAKLTQFHGSKQVSNPYSNAPGPFASQKPSFDVQQFSGNRGPHVIAPISSYTLMPHTSVQTYHNTGYSATSSIRGVTSYVPGYEVSKLDTHKGVTAYVPGHSAQQAISSQKGIATFSPGYEFNFVKVTPPGGLAHGGARPVPGPVSREGVTAYVPGYSTVPAPVTTSNTISTSTPGRLFSTPTTRSTTVQHVPGYQVAIKTPKNGIVCWDSSYETTHVSNNLIKNTLGGMWSHVPQQPEHVTPESARGPRTQDMALQPMFAVPIVDIPGKGLQATALGLPNSKTKAAPTGPATEETQSTWGEWYKRVARAVYRRWQNADVGPGYATVAVTVNADRSMTGRVVDFKPAADVERNVERETSFKTAALEAVNLVSEFEIPPFPSSTDGTAVTFEIEMKREVDGPTGFDVAATPQTQEPIKPVAAETLNAEKPQTKPASTGQKLPNSKTSAVKKRTQKH